MEINNTNNKIYIDIKEKNNKMYKIILDTNFLLIPVKFKVDIFREIERICNFKYELYIIDKTIDELKGKKGEKLANGLIKEKRVKVIKANKEGSVDEILKNLKNDKIIVATNDKELIKSLKFPIIRLKQKKYLEIKNVL